jgi:large subunit ribosomal protein L4
MKVQIYSNKGKKLEEVEFPNSLVAKPVANLVAQALYVLENRLHKGTSKAKTRAEVSYSTKKIYRQKGTGGARHGDKKAPIFVGGGVAHGPSGVKRRLNLSSSLRRLATRMCLGQKIAENAVCLVDGISSLSKTKEAASLLRTIAEDMRKSSVGKVRVFLGDDKKESSKYFRNIKDVEVSYWSNRNARDIYLSNMLVIDKDAVVQEKKTDDGSKPVSKRKKKAVGDRKAK